MIDFKRIFTISIIIFLTIISIIFCYNKILNKKSKEISEIVPEEEITDEQLRKTIINLYFKKEGELIKEQRNIDSKELLNNPYKKIINILIEGPEDKNNEKTIPEGTLIKEIKRDGDILIIDLSKEFIINHIGGEEEERLTINSIFKTVTQFTEINGIKILIEGKDGQSFNDGKINFKEIFKNI